MPAARPGRRGNGPLIGARSPMPNVGRATVGPPGTTDRPTSVREVPVNVASGGRQRGSDRPSVGNSLGSDRRDEPLHTAPTPNGRAPAGDLVAMTKGPARNVQGGSVRVPTLGMTTVPSVTADLRPVQPVRAAGRAPVPLVPRLLAPILSARGGLTAIVSPSGTTPPPLRRAKAAHPATATARTEIARSVPLVGHHSSGGREERTPRPSSVGRRGPTTAAELNAVTVPARSDLGRSAAPRIPASRPRSAIGVRRETASAKRPDGRPETVNAPPTVARHAKMAGRRPANALPVGTVAIAGRFGTADRIGRADMRSATAPPAATTVMSTARARAPGRWPRAPTSAVTSASPSAATRGQARPWTGKDDPIAGPTRPPAPSGLGSAGKVCAGAARSVGARPGRTGPAGAVPRSDRAGTTGRRRLRPVPLPMVARRIGRTAKRRVRSGANRTGGRGSVKRRSVSAGRRYRNGPTLGNSTLKFAGTCAV